MAPRLVLHFDVNETILCCDPAGGDTQEQSLNKMIAKNAYVKVASAGKASPSDELRWHDGTAASPTEGAPRPDLHYDFAWPEGAAPFYEVFRKEGQSFTHEGSRGRSYRDVYDALDAALRLTPGKTYPPALTSKETSQHHFLIPAFFHTIHTLSEAGRDFSVVIRTFGHDCPEVIDAINAFAAGDHPDFPKAYPQFAVAKERTWQGRYDDDGRFTLSGAAGVITDEALTLSTLEDASMSVCQDHYQYWADNNFRPSHGKPMWITDSARGTHLHIFFDDNIKNKHDDSIVAVRRRTHPGSPFTPLTGQETLELQGLHLHRVPTPAAVLDRNWFLTKINASLEAAKAST